jgi:hypothetical protein
LYGLRREPLRFTLNRKRHGRTRPRNRVRGAHPRARHDGMRTGVVGERSEDRAMRGRQGGREPVRRPRPAARVLLKDRLLAMVLFRFGSRSRYRIRRRRRRFRCGPRACPDILRASADR